MTDTPLLPCPLVSEPRKLPFDAFGGQDVHIIFKRDDRNSGIIAVAEKFHAALIVRAVNRNHLFEELIDLAQKINDSRTDTVGNKAKPQSLVETFWLNELQILLQRIAP